MHHLVGRSRRHAAFTAASVAVSFSWKNLFTFQTAEKLMTLGILVAFMQYAQRFFRPIQDLSEKYNILQSAMASAERVFKLLDTPVDVVTQPSRKPWRDLAESSSITSGLRMGRERCPQIVMF